jgi:hypothetical protein
LATLLKSLGTTWSFGVEHYIWVVPGIQHQELSKFLRHVEVSLIGRRDDIIASKFGGYTAKLEGVHSWGGDQLDSRRGVGCERRRLEDLAAEDGLGWRFDNQLVAVWSSQSEPSNGYSVRNSL